MCRALVLALTLLTSPASAGDRPERVLLEPRTAATEHAFVPEEHPVITTLLISGAVMTAAAVILVLVVSPSPRPNGLQFPNCVGPGC